MTGHHIAHPHLNEIGNRTLSLGHAEIHRHGLDACAFALFVLQHHVAHLRPVAVTYNNIIVALQKVTQRLTSLFYILYLFLISALLTAAKQRIAAKSHHCKFSHVNNMILISN